MTCDFLIIDTYNMIVRSAAGLKQKPRSKNALISVFLKTLKNNIDQFKPSKIIMPFDDYIGNNFRKKIFPEYKANRHKANLARRKDDEYNKNFKQQKDIVLRILEEYLPVYTLKYKGYEADDLIAMICKIASDDVKIVIWSNDHDLIQIQQHMDNVKVWDPQSKSFFKTPSYDIVAYKSLVGDRSDNIPGVKGIGPKSALKALSSQYEFIKSVGSKPHRYIDFRRNQRIINLMENDLPVPNNLEHILNKKVKYKPDTFKKIVQACNINSIIYNLEAFNMVFYQTILKENKEKRSWFFNK